MVKVEQPSLYGSTKDYYVDSYNIQPDGSLLIEGYHTYHMFCWDSGEILAINGDYTITDVPKVESQKDD